MVRHQIAPQLLRMRCAFLGRPWIETAAFHGQPDCRRSVGPCRPEGYGLAGHHVRQPGHRGGVLAREEVPVGIHRQYDRRVPHHRLHRLGVGAGQRQPSPAGVPETVEVEELPLVVLLSQEIALDPPQVFLGVLLGGLQPGLPGVGHVSPEHRGDVGPRRHAEHGRLGGLRGDVGAKQRGQGRLDVLPGLLPVLRRARLAGNERLVAVQE